MNKYLHYNDFLEVGENLHEGQKTRINHSSSDCDGDSNSLLVEKKDDGSINAYCFRCNRSGYYSSRSTLKSKKTGSACDDARTDAGGSFKEPTDINVDTRGWPIEALHWLKKYGITDAEIAGRGITYSESLSRVILPVFDADGLAFYQTRRIFDWDTKPKYLTYRNRDVVPVLGSAALRRMHCVLVEDYLSAIKVARVMPAIPLFSTKVRDIHVKTLISNGFTRFFVWLDDDNMQVKQHQLQNKKILDKIGKCTIIHTQGKDPKEHSEFEIHEILRCVL